MYKTFTVEEIKEMLLEYGREGGISPKDVPVEISTRMKRTFGAFTFKKEKNGKLTPLSFKFSLKLLSGDFEEKVVRDTVGHEYAHFLVTVRDNINHGHDEEFKKACRLLNVPEDTHFTGEMEVVKKKGYIIKCKKCRNEVSRRRRKDSTINILKRYRSGCCQSELFAEESIF